jgi:ABC-type glycerol-3-phosphate transport system substrate-binding protein
MKIKSRTGKVISVICASALVFGLSGFSLSANAAAKKVTIKVWDPGLMGHLVNGALDTKNSFIYQAKVAYEKLNPNITIAIS